MINTVKLKLDFNCVKISCHENIKEAKMFEETFKLIYKIDKLSRVAYHSESRTLKFFLWSSSIFRFLNSDWPGSGLTNELTGAPAFFSANLILGSSGTAWVRASWLVKLIFGSCKFTGAEIVLKKNNNQPEFDVYVN